MKESSPKRPRGNKTSKAARGARYQKEIALMNEGKTQVQIADELGISRSTFWRDIQKLTTQYAEGNQQAFKELRTMQVGALLDMAHEVRDGVITPEIGNSVRGFLDSVSRLLGLDSERRSVIAHITAESSPLFLKFKKASYGLTEEQLEQAFVYLASLPREKPEVVMDASWFPAPEPKQLETGDE